MSDRPTYIYALMEPDFVTVRYIGKTVNLGSRYKSHFHPNKNKRHTHKANWVQSLLKVGQQPIMVELECVPAGEDWAARERYWIAYYRGLGFDLTNHTDGGEGAPGARRSEETRQKIGDANRGKIIGEETRVKIGDANRGRNHSEESRRNMGAARRGKQRSSEAIEKTAEKHRGMKRSQATCAKLSDRSRGRRHTAEARAKMSESRQGRKRSPESVEKTAAAHRGRKRSDETCAKLREAWINRPRRTENTPESNAKRSEAMRLYWERKRLEKVASGA